MRDVYTIAWKEWKELLFHAGGWKGARLRALLYLTVFGVLLPLQWGWSALLGPAGIALWGTLPLVVILNVVSDAFAGERERHTLETLLASRIPDQAILLGKIAGALGYGWGMTLCSLALAAATLNISRFTGSLTLPSWEQAASLLLLSLLTGWLAAGAGVLTSLRAATVREAQQTLSIALAILMAAGALLFQLVPAAIKEGLLALWMTSSTIEHLLVAGLVLVAVDGALLGAAFLRFQRQRLLLG